MATATKGLDVSLERLEVSVYTVPSDSPDSDGTLRWDSTTMGLEFKRSDAERYAV